MVELFNVAEEATFGSSHTAADSVLHDREDSSKSLLTYVVVLVELKSCEIAK